MPHDVGELLATLLGVRARIREGSKQLSLGTSASGRQSNSMRNVISWAIRLPISVPYVSTRRDRRLPETVVDGTQRRTNPSTLSVVRLVAYGDEPTWIATNVAGTLNVPDMNCVMYFWLVLGFTGAPVNTMGMFLRHNPEIAGEGVVPDVLQVIPSHDEIVRDGILQCRDAALDLRPVTNIKGTPREEQKRTYVVCDATSHNPITNPVVRLEAYGETSLDRHLHVGHAECLEHEMRHVPQDSHEVHKCDRSN